MSAFPEGDVPTYVAQGKASASPIPYRSGVLYEDALGRTWTIDGPHESRDRTIYRVKVGTGRANLRMRYVCESLRCARAILHWHSERAKERASAEERARGFRASSAARFRR